MQYSSGEDVRKVQTFVSRWVWKPAPFAALLTFTLLLTPGCGEEPATTAPEASVDDSVAVVDAAPARPRPIEEVLREKLNLPVGGRFETFEEKVIAADLSGTPVKDLSAFAGTDIRSLDIRGTQVTDVTPLAKTKLEALFAEQTGVRDISPLSALPLHQLYLSQTPVTDLGPLAEMRLKELNLVDTEVSDIQPLADAEIGTLWLRGTKVSDLSPLSDSSLVSLDVGETPITDLSPIAKMRSLRRLHIADTDVTDLTPLKGLPLERLIFTPSSITKGLDAVREMDTLTQLDTRFDDSGRTLRPEEFWKRYDSGDASPTAGGP